MAIHPKIAMVLAAGLGQRMRPLTNTTPKPLLRVAGKRIIDYNMDALRAAGVERAVINKHYLPEQIEAWAKEIANPRITLSDESDAVLETGGGIARALPLLGHEPFYVLNSDCFWTESGPPALKRLAESWDDSTMDCLLLLCDPAQTTGYDGNGDFVIDAQGRLTRQRNHALAYIGGYLVHPRLFGDAPPGKFSMNMLWDRAISQGRLHGLTHEGKWFHVGTPAAIGLAEAELAKT